jgi:methylated-DNA-[protein]-cysteine S-methyltransferase
MPTTSSPWTHRRTDTPLGAMVLARSARGLCGAWFVEDQRHLPAASRFDPAHEQPDDALLSEAARQLARYFGVQRQGFDLPLDLSAGTPFQQAVWQALLALDWGHSGSYGQIAQTIGRPSAVRAVGAAVGRNPISLIVPCHRVLGSSGQLTGYAGGLWRKQALLQLENHSLF